MPHAENGIMSSTTVNGDKQQSAFISHIASYPVINDSIKTFKSNPIGQKSLDIADQGYSTFAKPFLPYFARPYEYVSPYVNKADSIADKGLSKVDEQFPVVKTPTDQIKGTVFNTVTFPFRVAAESKDYVFKTYGDEYRKIDGNGITRPVKAIVSTGLTVTADSLTWLSHFIGAKKEQGKNIVGEKSEHARHHVGEFTDQARGLYHEKADQTRHQAGEKTDQARGLYNEKADQAKNLYNAKADQAKGAFDEYTPSS